MNAEPLAVPLVQLGVPVVRHWRYRGRFTSVVLHWYGTLYQWHTLLHHWAGTTLHWYATLYQWHTLLHHWAGTTLHWYATPYDWHGQLRHWDGTALHWDGTTLHWDGTALHWDGIAYHWDGILRHWCTPQQTTAEPLAVPLVQLGVPVVRHWRYRGRFTSVVLHWYETLYQWYSWLHHPQLAALPAGGCSIGRPWRAGRAVTEPAGGPL